MFGENSYNQLGIGLSNMSISQQSLRLPPSSKIKFSTPQRLTPNEHFDSGTIRMLACGLFHTVAVITVDDNNSNNNNLKQKFEKKDYSDDNDYENLMDQDQKYEGGEKIFCWGLDPKTWRVKLKSDRHSQANQQANENTGCGNA